jgi:hypothetical protein
MSPGCSVLLRPASYEEGEPLVTYVNGEVRYSIPQRAVVGNSFLSKQLEQCTKEVDRTDPDNIKIRLEDPVFQDPYLFSLILDFLNRTLDSCAATLRQTDMLLSKQQWAHLVELERFVFQRVDRNPFWTGITGQDFRVSGNVTSVSSPRQTFSINIDGGILRVGGPYGFSLLVNLISLTDPPTRPVSLLRSIDMEYPFNIDSKSSFFIPHKAIRCTIEGVPTICEGVLQSSGFLRIEPINAGAFMWFHLEIASRRLHCFSIVYGDEVEVVVDNLWVPFEVEDGVECDE